MAALVIRVQDAEGRGPYRPGFSRQWSDAIGPICKPWWVELGLSMADAHARMPVGYHYGCGFRSADQLRAWFTNGERKRLNRLGFQVATILPDIVFAETPTQVVFGTREPLNTYPVEPLVAFARAA